MTPEPGRRITYLHTEWLCLEVIETQVGWAVLLWREGMKSGWRTFIDRGGSELHEQPEAAAALVFHKAGLLMEPDYKGVLDRLRRTVGGETFRTATREECGY